MLLWLITAIRQPERLLLNNMRWISIGYVWRNKRIQRLCAGRCDCIIRKFRRLRLKFDRRFDFCRWYFVNSSSFKQSDECWCDDLGCRHEFGLRKLFRDLIYKFRLCKPYNEYKV